MSHINFSNNEHEISWVATPEQEELMRAYRKPLERKLAEEQAGRYRKDPDKYRVLGATAVLVDEGVYQPFIGDRAETYTLHKTDDGYYVQYQYMDNPPIWLTEELGIKGDCIYRVTPTKTGVIVTCEVDITDYDQW